MANNVFQVKRTNVSGRTPNTTGSYATNSQYIAAGEFALNMADGILYTSNGSAVIEIGANNTNQRITNSLTVNNARNLNFQTVNTSAASYFIHQNDDNFVFYSTNTAYGARAVWGVFANSITSNLQVYIPLQLNSGLVANSSLGTAGQVLTTNGSATYWSSVSGTGTVTSVATGDGMTGGPITTTGTISILANTGIVANSTGTYVNATYIGTLTANNTSFVGTVSAANVVSNAQLSGNLANYVTTTNLTNNLANYQTTAGLSANVATLTANNTSFVGTVSAANVVSNAQLSGNLANYVTTTNLSNNLANYQTTAGLASNVATLTANNATNLNGQAAAFYTNATNITTGTLPYAQIPANIVNTTANFTIAGNTTFSGFINSTSTIATSVGANGIQLRNATSNWIGWNVNGVAAPTTTTSSAGTKLVLYPSVSATSVDYAIGIESNHMWFSSWSSASAGFKWYANTTNFMTANTTGLYHTGTVNSAILSTGTTFIANSTQVTFAVPVSANGGTGTSGQVLTSNGATGSPYWSTVASGGGVYMKGGSATVGTLGSEGQNIFRVNANTLNFNTTIAAGENAQATGPVAVASGITLTVQTGARVSIV